MKAAIGRIPKQFLYAAVELDAWAGSSVEPAAPTWPHDHRFEDLCRQ
jgi:hypothetical protein